MADLADHTSEPSQAVRGREMVGQRSLSGDLEVAPVEGSLVVSATDVTARDELLLVSPPNEKTPLCAEVVRIASVEGDRILLGCGIVHDRSRYTVANGAYLSRNLVANGCMEEPDERYWSLWGGPLRSLQIADDESGRVLGVESGDVEGVVFQTIMGLERGVEYELSCRCCLVHGNAWLVYHDPREPDSKPLEASGNHQEVCANACFMSPERPGPWRGGHRNRPEFLVGFRLCPNSRLLIQRVVLRRR